MEKRIFARNSAYGYGPKETAMMDKSSVKEIPYGISNFREVMEQNMYFVDKTAYIPELEQQARNLILIRPRRFGKSIFLSMLRTYYDIALKDKFQQYFGNLWIGSHPTANQGRYQILFFDFSKIQGGIDRLQESFDQYCSSRLNVFMDTYGAFYDEQIRTRFYAEPSFAGKLLIVDGEAHRLGYPLYLVIDEYDNFTNVVLNEHGEAVYRALTHADGFYRDSFKKFKGSFERIFMMGVSPVTLDDLTSGFNIGWNISTQDNFNMMLGFSETEVREMLTYYKEAGSLKGEVEELIEQMRPWYDNYCFAKQSLNRDPKMFNCDMVLYFLREYIRSGQIPEQMIDPNTRTDYNKMKRLLDLDHLDGDRKGVIRRIAEEGSIATYLETSFPARKLTDPDTFVSLLFYYGMLTITGTLGSRLVLGIPNNNVRKQYYEYLLEEYQSKHETNLNRLNVLFDDMAFMGVWQEAIQFVAQKYAETASVRNAIEGERNIQGFFTAYLSISPCWLTAPEVELNHGYCDLFLMPDLQRYPEVKHSYIIELKYLPAKDHEAQAESQWQAALEQIDRYAQGPRVQQLCQGTTLHKLILQFKGWDCVRMEEK